MLTEAFEVRDHIIYVSFGEILNLQQAVRYSPKVFWALYLPACHHSKSDSVNLVTEVVISMQETPLYLSIPIKRSNVPIEFLSGRSSNIASISENGQ